MLTVDMDTQTQEALMRVAIEEAQAAAAEGNYPFGAVISDASGKVLLRAHNTQNTDRDPTAHAEINIIRATAKLYSEDEIGSLVLVCNAESCSMCFSAAIKAGFRRFIFGAPSEPHMEPFLTVSELRKYCRQPLEITLGVLAGECRRQIQSARAEQNKLAQ